MIVYIDKLGHCHTEYADGRQAVEDDFFNNRAPEVIEGYICTLGDGGERMISPWQPWEQLDAIQREYEREQYSTLRAQNAQYEAALSAIEQALEVQT